jgi:hypothetical protein
LAVRRGPYLQRGTHDQITVRWRTNLPTYSRERYGLAPGNLTGTSVVPGLRTDHEVVETGLQPDTRYFYSVGDAQQTLAGADADHFFFTAPPVGAPQTTRIWAIGDAGTGTAGQRAVRDAYLAFSGNTYTDVWLMLGGLLIPGADVDVIKLHR